MPKREPVDVNKIVEVFKKVKSKRETARILGIHENTVHAKLRGYESKCTRCGKQLNSSKFKNCASCRKKLREQLSIKRKAKIRKGICVQCNRRIQSPSRQHCSIHRIKHLENTERSSRKSSRNVYGGIPTHKEKIRYLRWRYGQNAINLWLRLDGHCEICGIGHKDRAIHIHHIDKDGTNNSENNLTVVCQSCHRLTHLFTEHSNLGNFLSWIKEKYPNILL